MARGEKNMIGAAGEYHVAAELSRRGWLATITIKNAPDTDVLAQSTVDDRVIAIQTKTASPGYAFRLNKENERPASRDGQWVVLVQLGDLTERPRFFVIPRDHAAAMIYVGHRYWLSGTPRRGLARNDGPMRKIRPETVERYEDRWDLLNAPTADVPYLGDPWIIEQASELGLPEGHPWVSRLGAADIPRVRSSG